MCGIFGIKFVDRERVVARELVQECTDLMTHRGPDDAGYWVNGSLGLGHRRLSIIDLSPSGHQPMFNEDGSVALVYNGEIYNYLELCQPLADGGHSFRSRSDSEVIIHAYETWGHDSVSRLNGMFAFSVWDEKEQALWVVRDRLGVKPLYYYWDGSVFIFSSEIKPILRSGLVQAALNGAALDAYFTLGYVPAPETIFAGIKKLEPGHYLSLRDGKLSDIRYWDFAEVPPRTAPPRDLEAELMSLLRESVRIRLRSDVPLGVFLSGGLDSSAVVAVMSEMAGDPVNTFTVGYDASRDFTEEPFAATVARRFGTNHQVFKLAPEEFFSSLDQLVAFAEEPIVEPAAIALYHISRLAREKATVLLSGEGSDELFAGYYLYRLMGMIETLQSLVPAPLRLLGRVAASLSGRMKHLKYGDWLCQPLQQRYQGTSSYLTDSMKARLYTPEFDRARGDYLPATFSRHFGSVAHKKDPLSKMLYVDTKTWLVDDLLVKADKMTMAASIELRVPFLDYRLVEFAASLPSNLKLQGGNGKAILKAVMNGRVPAPIVARKKMGFPVPVANWFGTKLAPQVEEILAGSFLTDYLDKGAVTKLLGDHLRGAEDNSKLIMSLLVLVKWRQKFLGALPEGPR